MKVVVTGATGFIGRRLVRRLLAEGHAVVAWSRDPKRAAEQLPARCLVTRGGDSERCDPGELRGVDAAVNLAGESVAGGRWSEARKRAIRASRVDGTRSIVAAIAGLAPEERPKVLVSASAIGLYGDRGDEILDEGSAPGEGFLAEVCRAWEDAATAAERLGVRVVLPRIGVGLGPDGGALADHAMIAGQKRAVDELGPRRRRGRPAGLRSETGRRTRCDERGRSGGGAKP